LVTGESDTSNILEAARALLRAPAKATPSEFEQHLTDCAARVLHIEVEALENEGALDLVLSGPARARGHELRVIHARGRQLEIERAELRAVMRELRCAI
jgi:hypothetical protein